MHDHEAVGIRLREDGLQGEPAVLAVDAKVGEVGGL
jgi:hypothetical protein